MKSLADYIRGKGLKPGIYSEAGSNTCGSIYDNDTRGIGVGLYGHEEQDLRLMLVEWGYDFIKVDWCGGLRQNLSEQEQYTKISQIIRRIKPERRLQRLPLAVSRRLGEGHRRLLARLRRHRADLRIRHENRRSLRTALDSQRARAVSTTWTCSKSAAA